MATKVIGNSLLVQREELGEAGNQLLARGVFDYGTSLEANPGHVRSTADGVLTATDELLDGQEDTAIIVSVAQLLKNDRSSAGTVSFAGLAGAVVGGTAVYDTTRQTVTFTPTRDFNSKTNGQASFGYAVADSQGRQTSATAIIDVGSVDDGATLTVIQGQRQAGWQDIGITSTAGGQRVYDMPKGSTTNLRVSSIAHASVKLLGYFGPNGVELNASTYGAIGVYDSKLYYAGFATAGNQGSQTPWQEVWVQSDNGGTLTASDVDATGPIALSVYAEKGLDGRFGVASVVDNLNGTGSFNYARQTLPSSGRSWVATGRGRLWDGNYRFVEAITGPDDAFYVRLRQTVDGEILDKSVKVGVSADILSGVEDGEGRLLLPEAGGVIAGTSGKYNEEGGGGGQPIILDLNDNGFRFTAVRDSSAFYDLAGDGVRRATAWTSGKDGILAFDANNDGKISGKAEISFQSYLPGAKTDLEGLRAFDTNADGKFSALDAQWGKFRVWQDKNEDGDQSPDELSTLAERGIASIALTSNQVLSSGQGVTVHGIGSYTRIDGSQAQLADAEFAYTSETFGSITDDTITLTAANTVAATGAVKCSNVGTNK